MNPALLIERADRLTMMLPRREALTLGARRMTFRWPSSRTIKPVGWRVNSSRRAMFLIFGNGAAPYRLAASSSSPSRYDEDLVLTAIES
jgi:hypothetical protein